MKITFVKNVSKIAKIVKDNKIIALLVLQDISYHLEHVSNLAKLMNSLILILKDAKNAPIIALPVLVGTLVLNVRIQ